jgi:hypothetical protein
LFRLDFGEVERAALPNGKLVEEETNVDVVFKHLSDKQLKIEARVLLPNTHPLRQLTPVKCLTTTSTLVFSSFCFSLCLVATKEHRLL